MKISEFVERLQEMQEKFGDIDMALEDTDPDWVQPFDVISEKKELLTVETCGDTRYLVISGISDQGEFL